MQPFHQESVRAGRDCAVLRITGELDVYTAPQLREQVIKLVDGGIRHIVADLRGVGFLDSTGLGALVGSLKRLRAHDGSFRLAVSAGRILQVFQVTGLTRAFALHSSALDAIVADRHWQAALTGEGDDAEEWCRQHDLL